MLFHSEIPITESYTVLMVSAPVRLACFSFAGMARGVYYVEGDLRAKLVKPHDRRLLQAGLISLRFVGPEEKPAEYVYQQNTPVASTIVEPEPVRPSVETLVDDSAPIVIIEDPPKKRGRPRKAKSVAQEVAQVKLGHHDEDSSDADPGDAAAAEVGSSPEGSPAPVA